MRYRAVLHAITPIAHFDTRTGVDNSTNIRLAMTQPVFIGGRMRYIPHVSENALRSVLFRIPLADHLVSTLGIERGEMPRSVVNLLYAGGSMGSGRAPGNETALGHQIKKLYPSLDLLGGAVDTFILPRSRLRLTAWIVAREYASSIAAIFPELADAANSIRVADLLGEETRTRGIGDQADGNQMLYTYEVLAAGTRIAIELALDPWSPDPAVAAIQRAIAAWDGYIGGQGRQGRGRCRIEWLDMPPSAAEYDAHIELHRDAMRAGLIDGTLGTGRVICSPTG
jgi:hypothetical protein